MLGSTSVVASFEVVNVMKIKCWLPEVLEKLNVIDENVFQNYMLMTRSSGQLIEKDLYYSVRSFI